MVRFAHLLVLSALIIWLAGSGCVGNGASEVEKSGVDQKAVEVGNGAPAEDLGTELTQAEIQKLDPDTTDLENLLDNASLDEDILSPNDFTLK